MRGAIRILCKNEKDVTRVPVFLSPFPEIQPGPRDRGYARHGPSHRSNAGHVQYRAEGLPLRKGCAKKRIETHLKLMDERVSAFAEKLRANAAVLGGTGDVEWRLSQAPVAYDSAVTAMEERAEAIGLGVKPELLWLLEHPPLYTAGTSAKPSDLLEFLSVFRSMGPGAAANTPITGRVSSWLTCFSTSTSAAATSAATCTGLKPGRLLHSRNTAFPANAAREGPASGSGSRKGMQKSPQSACACAAGSPITASRSISAPIFRISPASCHAGSPMPV